MQDKLVTSLILSSQWRKLCRMPELATRKLNKLLLDMPMVIFIMYILVAVVTLHLLHATELTLSIYCKRVYRLHWSIVTFVGTLNCAWSEGGKCFVCTFAVLLHCRRLYLWTACSLPDGHDRNSGLQCELLVLRSHCVNQRWTQWLLK